MSRNDPLYDASTEREKKEEAARARLVDLYYDDLREMLATPQGMRVLFQWLDNARTFVEVTGKNVETTCYNAAISDYGRKRLLEILRADPDGYFKIVNAGFEARIANEKEQTK